MIRLSLQRAGLKFPIYSVPGGLEAIAFLNGDPPYQDRARYPLPTLVLLDIRMPRMDGFEVLRWIRLQPQFRELPIIMLTGSEAKRDADAAQKAGATSFFVKSLGFSNGAELSGEIRRLISTSG